MSLRNRIAARVLDAVIARVPRLKPGEISDDVAERPVVWGHVITGPDGDPYLTRVLFPRIPQGVPFVGGLRPMLHKFHRADSDRDCHNHPWSWAGSIILAGEYVEERLLIDESRLAGAPQYETKLVRWFNRLTDADYHRILELRGEVYTLFCAGPRTQGWGFLDYTSGKYTDWSRYLQRRKCLAASGAQLDELGQLMGARRTTRTEYLYHFGVPTGKAVTFETDTEYRDRLLSLFDVKIGGVLDGK